MANITGTSDRDRINSLGTYYWNGFDWAFLNATATTGSAEPISVSSRPSTASSSGRS